jgi:hypothetical protein
MVAPNKDRKMPLAVETRDVWLGCIRPREFMKVINQMRIDHPVNHLLPD